MIAVVEFAEKQKRWPEYALSVFGRRGVGLPVQKRRMVVRAGVVEELTKKIQRKRE